MELNLGLCHPSLTDGNSRLKGDGTVMTQHTNKILMVTAMTLMAVGLITHGAGALTQDEAMDAILGLAEIGTVIGMQVIMPDTVHGPEVVAWDHLGMFPETQMPYTDTWFAMVDQDPTALWVHSCLWVYLNNDNPSEYLIQERQTHAMLYVASTNEAIEMHCVNDPVDHPELLPCYEGGPAQNVPVGLPPSILQSQPQCVWAVIVGGQDNSDEGFIRDCITNCLANMVGALVGATVPDRQVEVLPNVTHDVAIKLAITETCDSMSACDILIFYYAGHGYADEDNCMLVHSWDNRENPLPGGHGVLTADELKAALEYCTEKICRTYVFLEACQSGCFIPVLTTLPNTTVVTACKSDESAWLDRNPAGGYWSNCFLGGVPEASAQAIHETCDNEVSTRVAEESPDPSAQRNQVPQYGANMPPGTEQVPIEQCCEPSSWHPTRWGMIKSLYR